MSLTLRQLREMLPEADLYVLHPEAKYLFLLKKSMFEEDTIRGFLHLLAEDGFTKVTVLLCNEPQRDLKIYELPQERDSAA